MINVNGAIMTLARYRATKAVKLEFQHQGLKPNHMARREIILAAENYLAMHRAELIAEAAAQVDRWIAQGVFGKRAQRAQRAALNTHAQKPKA